MPTNITIVHARDFVRATPDGALDFETAKELLIEIASATSHLADYEMLLDTRKAQVAMSVTDLWYLAVELVNRREAFSRKTAVLCPVEEFDFAAFFALCAENRGLWIKAFTTFDDAILWLIGIEPDA